jgi:DNA-binding PucR family transcriptional regulator
VLLGSTPSNEDPDGIRKTARKLAADVLIGIQGRRQVVVVGLMKPMPEAETKIYETATALEGYFGLGPLVLGPTVLSVSDASKSAKAALSALAVAATVNSSTRPTAADNLLPERALAGDSLAKQSMLEKYYAPLADSQSDLLPTLRAYLECGRSLEATSKQLFVHANTVRYRLKRIQEIIIENPTDPRTAFMLQIAIAVGAINDIESGVRR